MKKELGLGPLVDPLPTKSRLVRTGREGRAARERGQEAWRMHMHSVGIWKYLACLSFKTLSPFFLVSYFMQGQSVLENCPHVDQIKIMRVSAEEAKGPTYGR